MKIVNASNQGELARVHERHTEKLTRALINHILNVDNAVHELDRLGIRFWVHDNAFRRKEDLKAISVPGLVEILLKTDYKDAQLLPDGNILALTNDNRWMALP